LFRKALIELKVERGRLRHEFVIHQHFIQGTPPKDELPDEHTGDQ
jgi:hypothetical protein